MGRKFHNGHWSIQPTALLLTVWLIGHIIYSFALQLCILVCSRHHLSIDQILSFLLMALLPPPSSSSSSFTYDVFLSFRGTNTRHNFIGFLYKALCDKGIPTFIDDEKLPRGDEITPSLVKAIKESRIAIPVFSENYADSSFCLDELVNIIEQVKGTDRLVFPVFYKVDPSHVRHHTWNYGEALAKHEKRLTNNMERLQKWKMALHEAANLSGMHFKPEDGYEYKFIEKIVEDISNKISRTQLLHVANHPVGLESRMQKVMSLLDVKCNDKVLMVGIYGIGGIGKTTLAQAVFNSITHLYASSCFLHNVRENSTKHGLEHLQEKLLSEMGFNKKPGHVNKGIPIIRKKLMQKKVLLILDDVDNKEQLEALVGDPSWFGPCSRIIITTRDKHLLATHGVDRTYKIDELNDDEALELFKWNAFKKNDKVDPCYENILKQLLAYASGLPLALEVIGSLLFGKNIQEWRSAIDRFKKNPSKKILDKLKISYDTLEENQQNIFLDISCCFKGYYSKEIEDILSAHYGVCVKYDIGVLADKSLIKINGWNRVTMHDLIEELGKEIVRQESPKEPGKRSRLWFDKDIIQVLEENTATNEIEMIHLNSWLREEVVEWDGESFRKMKNLRTLIICNAEFCKGPEYLPNSLRVLEWFEYPSLDLPPDFHPKNLSICKLHGGCLTSFEMPWSFKTSKLMNMRVLKLDFCKGLTRIPDVSCLPNLESFSFQCCENLVTIHDTVGLLHKLKYLDAHRCSKIKKFPPLRLPSLEKLDLFCCSSLKSFPEILVKMENMTELDLLGTPIKEFPSSFGNISGLQMLRLEDEEFFQFATSSILMMPQLAKIHISSFNEPIEKDREYLGSNQYFYRFPNEFLAFCLTWCANLKALELWNSDITVVPECIKECRFLGKLVLNGCRNLEEIRGIPHSLQKIYLNGCEKLEEIRGIPFPHDLQYLSAVGCFSLSLSCRSMLLNQEVHEAGNTNFVLPSPERGIPEWFEHQSKGPPISFWFHNNFPHIALCLVSKVENNYIDTLYINDKQFDYKDDSTFFWCLYGDDKMEDHTQILHIGAKNLVGKECTLDEALSKNEWNEVEVILRSMYLEDPKPIRFGIHVLNGRSSNIRITNPYEKRMDAHRCSKIKKFPPLRLPSLEELHLSDLELELEPELKLKLKLGLESESSWFTNVETFYRRS